MKPSDIVKKSKTRLWIKNTTTNSQPANPRKPGDISTFSSANTHNAHAKYKRVFHSGNMLTRTAATTSTTTSTTHTTSPANAHQHENTQVAKPEHIIVEEIIDYYYQTVLRHEARPVAITDASIGLYREDLLALFAVWEETEEDRERLRQHFIRDIDKERYKLAFEAGPWS